MVIGAESGMSINISGSNGSKYGVVTLDIVGNQITSSLLPIFNDNFFGIKVSRI